MTIPMEAQQEKKTAEHDTENKYDDSYKDQRTHIKKMLKTESFGSLAREDPMVTY